MADLCGCFCRTTAFRSWRKRCAGGDVKEAFRGAHTLKGVCQNLGFSNLYAPTYTLTETLRAGQLEGTQEQFAKVAEQYQCTMDAIRALD
ncbi:Hpt domain-containing protein [Faecalibacterium prausnitzii]